MEGDRLLSGYYTRHFNYVGPKASVAVLLLALSLLAPPAASAHEDELKQIAHLTRQLQTAPEDAQLLRRRGRLFTHLREYAQALDDLNAALAFQPQNLEPLAYRGLIYFEQGEPRRALQELDRYVTAGRPYFLAFEVRAQVRATLDDTDGAIEDLRAAAALRPKPEYHVQRARLLEESGRLEEAIAGYEEALAVLGPSVPLVLELVRLQAALGLIDEALSRLAAMEKKARRKEAWMLRRADILAGGGRPVEATQLYAAALAQIDERLRRKRTDSIVLQRAHALAGLGRKVEARKLVDTLGPDIKQLAVYDRVARLLILQQGGER